jgi:hypothetical protein
MVRPEDWRECNRHFLSATQNAACIRRRLCGEIFIFLYGLAFLSSDLI